MNANPQFLSATATVDEAASQPLPNSRKIYVPAAARISACPCAKSASLIRRHVRFGKNPPIYVYDTSGIYTDPDVKIDIRSGLPALRAAWIAERNDTEELAGQL
jgi:phosphomethylpyrimidine synthase